MRALDSPCIDVCTLDAATGTCLGCARTLDEIQGWVGLTPPERAAINAQLPQRRAALEAQRAAQAAVASRWPASKCSRCGNEFACGATDCTTPCWCASYPPVDPVAGAACLCPGCLAATVAAAAVIR